MAVDYAALAAQHGGQAAPTPDYASLASKYGGVPSTTTDSPRGSVPTPPTPPAPPTLEQEATSAPGLNGAVSRFGAGVANFGESVLNPFARLGVGIYDTAKAGVNATTDLVKGRGTSKAATDLATQSDQPRTIGGYEVNPLNTKVTPQTVAGAVQSGASTYGGALQIASNFFGGEGASAVTDEAGSQTVLRSALQGAKVAGKAGATYGLGTGLTDVDPSKSLEQNALGIAGDTAVGGATGLAGGALLGTVAGSAGTTHAMMSELSKGNVPEPLLGDYRDALNLTPTQLAKDTGSGKDTAQFLAQEKVPVSVSGGMLNADAGIAAVAQKQQDEHAIMTNLLKSEGKYVNLDDVGAAAKQQIASTIKGSDQAAALAHVDSEIAAYKQQFGVKQADGTVAVPLDQLNEIKQDLWGKSKFDVRTPSNISEANRMMGNAAKTTIEQRADSVPVRQLNQRLGDLNQAQKTLELRNGKPVAGGGKTGQIVGKLLGGVAGSSGGPIGTLFGAKAGEILSGILTDGSVDNGLKQSIIDRYLGTTEGQQVLQQVKDIIAARSEAAMGMLKLPAASAIPQAPASPNVNGGQFYSGIQGTPSAPRQ